MEPIKIRPILGIFTIFNFLGVLSLGYIFLTSPKTNDVVLLRSKSGASLIEVVERDGGGTLLLRDANGKERVQLQATETAAVMIKNSAGELVATLFTGHDNAGMVGLGDESGNVSSLFKGGADPSVAFFQGTSFPSLSFGIHDAIPHILFYAQNGEQLILHGGATNSLLFVDKGGAVPLMLTKDGIKKEKAETTAQIIPPYRLSTQKLLSTID